MVENFISILIRKRKLKVIFVAFFNIDYNEAFIDSFILVYCVRM